MMSLVTGRHKGMHSHPSNDQEDILLDAPAKVNLFLHVVGRRSNGFHELESLFVFTETGDKVRLRAGEGLTLTVDGPFAAALREAGGVGPENLVCKAAKLLAASAGCAPNVHITLTKNLPVASGIGGGSADAAATLKGLITLWGLDISERKLRALAFDLGADVPACLRTSPLYVSGVGEKFAVKTLPKAYGILLVNAGYPVSTPAVFSAYKADNRGGFDAQMDMPLFEHGHSDAFLRFLKAKAYNALQRPAETICPVITEVLGRLKQMPDVRHVAMSGSGGSCFALFDTQNQAKVAKEVLEQHRPDWWLKADSLIKE